MKRELKRLCLNYDLRFNFPERHSLRTFFTLGNGGIDLKRRLYQENKTFNFINEKQFSITNKSMQENSASLKKEEKDVNKKDVVIAVGANIGNRIENIENGLRLLRKEGLKINRHGLLYESAPKYYTDQPYFLNSAFQAQTALSPHDLLSLLKKVEFELGRNFHGVRNGPRPLDLDIIFYENEVIDTDTLQIPHPRLLERPFVLAPVVDLLDSSGDKTRHWSSHPCTRVGITRHWERLKKEINLNENELRQVFPINGKLCDLKNSGNKNNNIMGILNVTPDSFSDGGKYMKEEDAIAQAKKMVHDGASIIDIGGQSTRPGSSFLSAEEELSRILPILKLLQKCPELKETIISVDTFHAQVAKEVLKHGAHIINDVSGGSADHNMFLTIAEHDAAYLLSHMRGTIQSMHNRKVSCYNDVCHEVADELYESISIAESAGIPIWRIILDVGLGFSKASEQNLNLLSNLGRVRSRLGSRRNAVASMPILIGPSRKRFLKKIVGREGSAEDRDFATCAACVMGCLNGADLFRVHNVLALKDSLRVVDAINEFKVKND